MRKSSFFGQPSAAPINHNPPSSSPSAPIMTEETSSSSNHFSFHNNHHQQQQQSTSHVGRINFNHGQTSNWRQRFVQQSMQRMASDRERLIAQRRSRSSGFGSSTPAKNDDEADKEQFTTSDERKWMETAIQEQMFLLRQESNILAILPEEAAEIEREIQRELGLLVSQSSANRGNDGWREIEKHR